MEIRKRRRFVLGALLASVIIAGPIISQSQGPAEKIYQTALLKKTGDGNLEEAIRLFQQIVKEYPHKRNLPAKLCSRSDFVMNSWGKRKQSPPTVS